MASNPITHIKDLIPDPKNARVHGERNIGMIVQGLRKVGAARSIVCDEDGVILAGNGTIEAAATAGITKVQVVDADGDTIIAVRRTGLTDEQKVQLAIYDNRTNELSGWDQDTLVLLKDEGVNLNEFWFKDELPEGLIDNEKEPRTGGKSPKEKDPTERSLSIELKFDEDEFAAFKEMTDQLAKEFKTTNVQDTLVASLRKLTNRSE